VAVAAILAALGGCERGPQPFAHTETGRTNKLLQLADRAGIVVLDVDGAPERASRALSDSMARALLDSNVPAATEGGNRTSNFLQGRAMVREVGAGRVEVTVVWELVDRRGQAVGTRSEVNVVDVGAWRDGAAAAAAPFVAASAPAIAAMVQDALPAPRRDPIAGRAIRISAIDGAPPPAERAMRRHMGDALRRAGFALGDADAPNVLSVDGKVRLGPDANGTKRIDIAWSVRGSDGRELGNLKQGNVVETADLDGDWGQIAWAATTTAVDGIVDLLRGIDASPNRASEGR
jgi:hypothetical protein